jgi:hypothetical protein
VRRDIRDELIAWTIGLLSLAAVTAALLTGCAVARPTEASEFSATEMALVDDTARWAGQLEVNVRGEITTRTHITPQGRATGWYEGGVAYYDREMVAEWVRLVPTPGCETAANVAAHEVAHALYPTHDISHWCCTVHMGATPTYPPPVVGAQCEGRAKRCLTSR